MKEVTTKELVQWRKEKRAFTIVDARALDYFYWEHIRGAVKNSTPLLGKKYRATICVLSALGGSKSLSQLNAKAITNLIRKLKKGNVL